MRLRKARSGSEDAVLDMTPMIDMTFQLITFFMFTLNFSNDLLDERVRLPLADSATPTSQSPQSPVYINMSREGLVYLLGGEAIDPKADSTAIRRHLAVEAQMAKVNMKVAGVDTSTGLWTTIIIRADDSAPYGNVQKVIQIAQQTGFTKFWLRANKTP
ncbi:MAG: biopolymer transporter ExbD [Planctomycetota bacterium]|nr:MAG: biopolymer transporter ExbD [Planctomycetota bacterium]